MNTSKSRFLHLSKKYINNKKNIPLLAKKYKVINLKNGQKLYEKSLENYYLFM